MNRNANTIHPNGKLISQYSQNPYGVSDNIIGSPIKNIY